MTQSVIYKPFLYELRGNNEYENKTLALVSAKKRERLLGVKNRRDLMGFVEVKKKRPIKERNYPFTNYGDEHVEFVLRDYWKYPNASRRRSSTSLGASLGID